MPEDFKTEWEKWKIKLPALQELHIKRCFMLPDFGKVSKCSLHHFSDAYEIDYGQASYLKLVDEKGKIHGSLVMGKSSVAPVKYISVPRLELVATKLSVKISVMLREELQFPDLKEMYWTDSKAVLGYIKNQSKRFKIFVANRVEMIVENSQVGQWFYVNTKENPADLSSRGINTTNGKAIEIWFNNPSFLWQPERTWKVKQANVQISADDPELRKKVVVNFAKLEHDLLKQLQDKISTWSRMKQVVSVMLKFKSILRRKARKDIIDGNELLFGSKLLHQSETEIVKMVQRRRFSAELKILTVAKVGKKCDPFPKSSKMNQLGPFLNSDALYVFGEN